MNNFKREDRYIVIKRSDLARRPTILLRHADAINEMLAALPDRKCLIIESDWPEYEPAWAAIEARVTGAAQTVVVDGLPERLPNPFRTPAIADSFTSGCNAMRDACTPIVAKLTAERDAALVELKDLRESMAYRTSLIGRMEAERNALQAKLDEAMGLLHVASIRLARWLDQDDDPRKQIIAFLEAAAEPAPDDMAATLASNPALKDLVMRIAYPCDTGTQYQDDIRALREVLKQLP